MWVPWGIKAVVLLWLVTCVSQRQGPLGNTPGSHCLSWLSGVCGTIFPSGPAFTTHHFLGLHSANSVKDRAFNKLSCPSGPWGTACALPSNGWHRWQLCIFFWVWILFMKESHYLRLPTHPLCCAQYVHVLISNTCHYVTLHGEKDFVAMSRLKILRWRFCLASLANI